MAHVVVSTVIDRPVAEVWDDVRDISTHVTWMADAAEIRFLGEQTEGLGTRFECLTKVGPLSTVDVMEITAWEPEARMGVRHSGVVTGEGEFTLRAVDDHTTEFRWEEDLSFPWFFGGPVGELAGKPILTAIWKRNLRNLRARLHEPTTPSN